MAGFPPRKAFQCWSDNLPRSGCSEGSDKSSLVNSVFKLWMLSYRPCLLPWVPLCKKTRRRKEKSITFVPSLSSRSWSLYIKDIVYPDIVGQRGQADHRWNNLTKRTILTVYHPPSSSADNSFNSRETRNKQTNATVNHIEHLE